MANSITHSKKMQQHILFHHGLIQMQFLFLLIFVPCFIKAQNTFPASGSAGVGTNAPDVSSLFEMKSTTKGFLISRMTKAQRDLIVSPALGLMIFQTNNTPGFYYYDGGQWVAVAPKGPNKSLSNLSAPTAVNVDLLSGSDNTVNLGSLAKSWKNIYADGSIYLDGQKFLDNAGTANTFLGFTGNTTNTGSNNTFSGSFAGNSNTSANNNSFFGYTSGYFTTSGSDNSFFGQAAGNSNTTGASNCFFGKASGFSNLNGTANTFLGYAAGYSNTANDNTFVGYRSGQANTSGYANSFFGVYAGYNNSDGIRNSFFGDSAGYWNSGGKNNAAFGYQALFSNGSGYSNVANGAHALASNTTGRSNVAVGSGALYKNSSGDYLVAVGDSALYNNNPGAVPFQAIQNTAVGSKSLYSNTTGYMNTAIGDKTLYSNSGGFGNTANGAVALFSNTNGYHNTASGSGSLYHNTTGDDNTATGNGALYLNTTGNANTANGHDALYRNNTGYLNTAVGTDALYYNSTGYLNTAIGNGALSSNGTGFSNTAIGNGADVNSDGYYNSSAVGTNTMITASNQVRLGSSGVTSIGGYANWTNISDGRVKKNIKTNVPGLSFINKLKPVTYNLDLDAEDKILQRPEIKDNEGRSMKLSAENLEARKQKEQVVYTGFVAQEVEKAAKELHYDFSGVDAAKNEKDLYGLRYAEFVVPLVKAVQELSAQNEKLRDQNDDLGQRVSKLEAIINGQQSMASSHRSTVISPASLSQNIPNPFNKTTTINYSLPAQYSSAKITITNKNGSVLKQINLAGNGKGSVNLDASTLSSGAYQYSLIVDGKLIVTKQMEHLK